YVPRRTPRAHNCCTDWQRPPPSVHWPIIHERVFSAGQRTMIKAISYWSMKQGLENTHPIDDALASAKAAGFQGMELSVGTDGAFHVGSSQAECEAIRGRVDASGLT